VASSELPDDLTELEERLANRMRRQPTADFRQNILGAVRQELQEGGALAEMRCTLQFVAAVVALVVLCANLSMSIANDMVWQLSHDPELPGTTAVSTGAHQLFSGMSEQEGQLLFPVVQGNWGFRTSLDARAVAHFERSMMMRQASPWKRD
jgi:hypothetical protein